MTTTPSSLTRLPSHITNAPWNYLSTTPYISPSQKQLNLPVQSQIQANDSGEELRVKGLRETVTEQFKAREQGAMEQAATQSKPAEKQTRISLKDKVVHIQYIGVNGIDIEDEIELATTHWLIAAIMNVFAKIFPCCVQGAAKFSFDNQTCYVRRVLIQEKIHMQIQRHEFKCDDPQANTLKLKVLSFEHFKSEE